MSASAICCSNHVICEICNKCFSSEKNLAFHIKSHGLDEFPCFFCSKNFESMPQLQAHYKRHPKYFCDICHWDCYSRKCLALHRKVHSYIDIQPVERNKKNLDEIEKHYSVHNAPFNHCELCMKSFVPNSYASNRSAYKPYKCSDCKKFFSYSYGLHYHHCKAKQSK